jgi:hypothetical protein
MFWSAALLRRFFSPTKRTKIAKGFRHVRALKNEKRRQVRHGESVPWRTAVLQSALRARKPRRFPDSPFSALLPIRVIRAIRGCRLFPGGFKRAVFRRPLPDKWSEFHFAADRVWRFELSLKHQCSRVAAHVSERKFHRAGKRH